MSGLTPAGYCRDCRIPVIWSELTTGELLPVSIAVETDGDVLVRPRPGQAPRARILTGDDLAAAREQENALHAQHQVACPARPPEGPRP